MVSSHSAWSGAAIPSSCLIELAVELFEHDAGVADDRDLGSPDLADLRGVDVDVNDLGVRGEGIGIAGDPVVEAGSDRDEEIGLLHGGDGGVQCRACPACRG